MPSDIPVAIDVESNGVNMGNLTMSALRQMLERMNGLPRPIPIIPPLPPLSRESSAVRAMRFGEVYGMGPANLAELARQFTPDMQVPYLTIDTDLARVEEQFLANMATWSTEDQFAHGVAGVDMATAHPGVIPHKHTPSLGMPDATTRISLEACYEKNRLTYHSMLPPLASSEEQSQLLAKGALIDEWIGCVYRYEDGTYTLAFKFPELNMDIGAEYLATVDYKVLKSYTAFSDAGPDRTAVRALANQWKAQRQTRIPIFVEMMRLMIADEDFANWHYLDTTPALDALNEDIRWKSRPTKRAIKL